MAQATVTVIGLNVPELTDNTIAFANAAAWNAYWLQGEFTISFNVADTNNYGLVKSALTLAYVPVPHSLATRYTIQADVLGNGVFVDIPVSDADYVDSLTRQVEALDAAVQQMRTAMKAAGLISQAQ